MKICETCQAAYDGALDRCPLDRGRLIEAPDPLIDRVLQGSYRIVARIGRGAIASVYRARHELAGRDVAIKVLSPAMARSPTLRERFLREARAANRVRHPHVIDIADVGETEDGLAFLVMELLEGMSLAQALAAGPLAPTRALVIAAQTARALERAHALGIVHRDIKPANVFLLGDGATTSFVKLLDFGLANVRGEQSLTATGDIFGTPSYMAPEQIEGARATPAVDLYALGCVLFELLTGAPPFQGTTPVVLDRHLRAPPPLPSERVPALGPSFDGLVARLLAKDPAQRGDARGLSRAIERLLEQRLSPSVSGAGPEQIWESIEALAERLEALLRLRAELARCAPERRGEIEQAISAGLEDLERGAPRLLALLHARRSDEP